MIQHSQVTDSELKSKIHHQKIHLGGNQKLKIYGLLSCSSGKRMKRQNRVFFTNEKEAIQYKYRPCGHCMKEKYKAWKDQQNIQQAHN